MPELTATIRCSILTVLTEGAAQTVPLRSTVSEKVLSKSTGRERNRSRTELPPLLILKRKRKVLELHRLMMARMQRMSTNRPIITQSQILSRSTDTDTVVVLIEPIGWIIQILWRQLNRFAILRDTVTSEICLLLTTTWPSVRDREDSTDAETSWLGSWLIGTGIVTIGSVTSTAEPGNHWNPSETNGILMDPFKRTQSLAWGVTIQLRRIHTFAVTKEKAVFAKVGFITVWPWDQITDLRSTLSSPFLNSGEWPGKPPMMTAT